MEELERRVGLALQLGLQNHEAMQEIIEAHKLAISRYDVADKRLNRGVA